MAYNVKGVTVNQLLNMDIQDFNRLKEDELRVVVNRMVSAGNKRLARFSKAGEASPATTYVSRSGGKFSSKGKDLNQLRSEYARIRSFMNSATGSLSGWNKYRNTAIKTLKKQGVAVSQDDFGKMWRAYNNLKEADPSISERQMRYAVLREVAEVIKENSNLSVSEITSIMQGRLDTLYQQQQELLDNAGISELFEAGGNL